MALLLWLALSTTEAAACNVTDDAEMLLKGAPALAPILATPDVYKIQVTITEVVPTPDGECLRRRTYRSGAEYFYPASTIKLLGAIAALNWARTHPGLTFDTPLLVELPALLGGKPEPRTRESSTLRETLEATLTVSSNSAYNRLFDLAGRDRQNRAFWDIGAKSVRIRHRLGARGFPRTVQHFAPPVRTVSGKRLESLREDSAALPSSSSPGRLLGEAHLDLLTEERIEGPLDFSGRNAITLEDLQDVLVALVRPDLSPGKLGLTVPEQALLREIIARIVHVEPEPGAPPDRVRYKPLLAGLRRGVAEPGMLHFENKSGRAYGFLTDNAYVLDRRTGRELFIAATIYVNGNRVLGDDVYEYDTVGLGFMEALGERVAEAYLR